MAGCGVTVAKHGNRSISSRCGSADLLEALDVVIDLDPEIVEEAVNEIGLGFLFAPMVPRSDEACCRGKKRAGYPQHLPTCMGPLTNPAAARCQLLGVFDPGLTEMFARTLKLLGTHRAFVVHGHDGMDEITVCAPTRVSELSNGLIRSYDLDPLKFFDAYADPKELKGGDAKENAGITLGILKGERGARRNIVLINSAAALVAADAAEDLSRGITMAESAIDSGRAMEKLEQLINFTQENS